MKSLLKFFVLLFCLHFIEGAQLFRCDYTYNKQVKGWLKHIIIPANWYDARLRCALEGAVLASPTSIKMRNEMVGFVNVSGNEESFYEIFTGIHATFAPGAYMTVEGKPLSKIPQVWAPNEPDNKEDKESCLTLNSNGELADVSCGTTRPYVCYRSADSKTRTNECGTVDPEYRLDARTNSCYKFHTVAKNFTRAFFTCYAEGGYLAVINSDTEATVLRELFAKYPGGQMQGNFWKDVAFIGFHDWGERWDFRSIHGKTLKETGYGAFSGGEPNNFSPGEQCGAIYRSGKLDDLWCDRPAAFICEKDPDYPDVCRAEVDEQ
uniref:IML17 n=1 Tax=Mythimna separata TaxID=271217 RepID=A0A8F3HLP4_MYTSE|nr:IML17 [Mythimna separata]